MRTINIHDNDNLLKKHDLEVVRNTVENLDFDWCKNNDVDVFINQSEDPYNQLWIEVFIGNEFGQYSYNTSPDLLKHEYNQKLEEELQNFYKE